MANYVLIPGAWHGGWAWAPVARRLRAAGHGALTLTMPGLNDGDDPAGIRLPDAVDHVVEQVRRRDLTDVVLVAHSWGGYPVTGAAPALTDRLSRIVYYNANVPARGESMLDGLPPERAAAWRELLASSPAAPASLEFVRTRLMQDQPPETQRLLWELMVPQPRGYWQDALDGPGVRELGVPATYVLSTDDVLFAVSGPVFAARLGVEPVAVPGSHESLLTHPDEVAAAMGTPGREPSATGGAPDSLGKL